MHPFSLNEEQIKQVSGGVSDPIMTTMAIGEEGGDPGHLTGGSGQQTTLALGEEGGLPPVDLK